MSNLSLYHQNILSTATVSATQLEPLFSPRFLADDRLSFKLAATGTMTTIQIDQPTGSVQDFQFFLLLDHSLGGGEAVIETFPTQARLTPTVIFSGTLSFEDPGIVDLGSVPPDRQFVDVSLTASGTNKVQVGELMLASKFESPQRPALGITTRYLPRRTFIELPNGERQSIKHAETVRQKQYAIPGLTFEQAREWIDLFRGNEGAELVVLTDDEGETYPALMSQQLEANTTSRIVSLAVEFTEVKL